MKQLKKSFLPGLILSFIVAWVSKGIAIFLPTLGGATIAILLGILLGNTIFKQSFLGRGTKLAESKLLEWSVVLLGMTVTFQTISTLGLNGIGYIIVQMTTTIVGVYVIGHQLNFSKRMTLLMAGGNAVCGSSAIGAIAPEIHAGEEEKGQIITLVNLLGTILMLLLPILATQLYPQEVITQSAMIGGILQSVGQVVASANMVSQDVVTYATLFKIMRIIMLVAVVYIFGKIADKDTSAMTETFNNHAEQPTKKFKLPLPWYVLGFLLCCLLNSFVSIPTIVSQISHSISGWFEITALAAIGLRLDFSRFFKEGKRFLIFGLSVGVLQVISAIIWIFIFHVK
ncbi:YeiH family protein [Vagococcus vulneris]